MRVSIDYTNLVNEHSRSLTITSKAKTRAKNRIRKASEQILDQVSDQMPVDTGAAVYRWGNPVASDGIWIEEDDGMSITQGAGRVPFEYISRLEEGSSTQAPAGFISAIVTRVAEELGTIMADEIALAMVE